MGVSWASGENALASNTPWLSFFCITTTKCQISGLVSIESSNPVSNIPIREERKVQ